MTRQTRNTLVVVVYILAGACLLSMFSMVNAYRLQGQDLEKVGEQAVRVVSQRADQHDAHLSSLSALAGGAAEPLKSSILQVAATIHQFYPRIVGVNLVSLDPADPFSVSSNKDPDQNLDRLYRQIRMGALASEGRLVVLPDPDNSSRYLLIKRSPNSSDARYGLALTIDIEELLAGPSVGVVDERIFLTLDDRQNSLPSNPLTESLDNDEWIPPLVFEARLSSQSQPLNFKIVRHSNLSSLISVAEILAFAVGWAGFVILVSVLMDQRRKTREAQSRASLREHEASIAHASRINSLGEMASGIAHELNQPLTALLSQSQAAVHILAAGEHKANLLKETLEANVGQARRAGEILNRLRNWIKKDAAILETVELNRVVASVNALLQHSLAEKNIRLALELPQKSPQIVCDSVQLEQVVFNLVINAIEAIERSAKPRREIRVKVAVQDLLGIIEVWDDGDGISVETEARLFEPFFTTKENGIGFGLPLCESILQLIGGRLEIENHPGGGVVARVLAPLAAVNK